MTRLLIHPGIYIDMEKARWNARDRAACAWPQRIKPSQWAEKYRVLTKSAIPGRWRNENAPYLRGIMDLAVAPGVEELTIKKAAQMGVSEAMRTLMGCWAYFDPEPMGLALPSKEKGREIIENEILPFFRNEFGRIVELRELLSPRLHDLKKGQIKLANGFILHLMWSGSSSSMASNPMKRAISDEVDKFQAWAGNDADPASLIEFRLRTYPGRIHVLVSTPTMAEGQISRSFAQSHYQFYYLVPCPHCTVRQRLLFGDGGDYGVKWSAAVRALHHESRNEEAAAAVLREGVEYECAACHKRFDERLKRAAVRGGKWGTVGSDGRTGDGVIEDAESVASWPRGTKLGLQMGSLYCCWENWTMAHVASQFLAARSVMDKFAFRTSTLGETWETLAGGSVSAVEINDRVTAATLEEGIVPSWAARLIGVVDTQKDHFWLVIRAWGPAMRSQRVWHGKVTSFEEIEQWCFRTPWKNQDSRMAAKICDKVFIDSGGTKSFGMSETGRPLPSRVMEVYAWCLKNQANVSPIKGDNRPEPGKYIRRGHGEYVTDREKYPVGLWLLDVHHFQDQLADMMQQKLAVVDWKTGEVKDDEAQWQLNKRPDVEYDRHMSAMHKVQRMLPRGGSYSAWEPKYEGKRIDYRACEGYQVAAAFMTGVHLLPDLPTYMAAMESELAAREIKQRMREPESAGMMRTPDGRAFLASQRER